jgi:hypothetical protein
MFDFSSIRAICQVRRKAGISFYRVEYAFEGLSGMIDSHFHPGMVTVNPNGHKPCHSRRVWIPALIVEHAVPAVVAGYKTRRKHNAKPVCRHWIKLPSHIYSRFLLQCCHQKLHNVIDLTTEDPAGITISDVRANVIDGESPRSEFIDLTEDDMELR